MDPTTLLHEIRRLITEIDNTESLAGKNAIRERVIDHVQNLDDWLSKGGMPPRDWLLEDLSAALPPLPTLGRRL